jgi:iron complex outermembrane receptor protein
MGGRFEPTIIVRGFDIRGIPVFVDGIPLQMPYDGDIDLGQLSTFDYSQVSLTKGIAPMSLGPNTIGGSINLVSFQPTDKVDVQAITGWGSGNTYEYGINAGSRGEKFFVQGSYYERLPTILCYRIATNLQPISLTERGIILIRFPESKSENRIHFCTDQRVHPQLSISEQCKRNPPYSGIDDKQSTRFWQWPVWKDKVCIHFEKQNKRKQRYQDK